MGIDKDKIVCQDDCDFTEYDYETLKAKCSCKVKESSSSFLDMNINKTKLYENFINIKNILNLKILSCFKKLFSKKGISKNIGNYILIFIITFHIISIFIFYFKQYIIIKNKINDIIYAINYSEFIKPDKEKKKKEKIKLMITLKKWEYNRWQQ